MTTASLLAAFRRYGVEIAADGGDLVCRAPRGVLSPEVRDVLAVLKPALLAELEAEAAGCRRDPDGPGWVETPGASAACSHGDGPLAPGNAMYCAGHETAAVARFGYAVGRSAPEGVA